MPKRKVKAVLDDLLETLSESDRPLSTREISQKAGIDWNTVKKYLSFIQKFSEVGRLTHVREEGAVL